MRKYNIYAISAMSSKSKHEKLENNHNWRQKMRFKMENVHVPNFSIEKIILKNDVEEQIYIHIDSPSSTRGMRYFIV